MKHQIKDQSKISQSEMKMAGEDFTGPSLGDSLQDIIILWELKKVKISAVKLPF